MVAYPVKGKQKSVDLCNAFLAGAPVGSKGCVFYGVNQTNLPQWQAAVKGGTDWYYIDNSYFDLTRHQRFRITKNRIQINAKANRRDGDGERFRKLGITLQPWKTEPGSTLVIEQSMEFMRDIAREPGWLARAINDASARGRPWKVRPWGRDKMKLAATLPADLVDAGLLLTHTSAAAVTAVIAGVPIAVSNMHALAHMLCSTDPAQDERRSFLEVLANNEFTVEEIKTGAAWQWLNQ